MEGCDPAVQRRLRRGCDVRTADDTVAVDDRQMSTASDTVVSRGIHRRSECVTTVVPKLAAAPQADFRLTIFTRACVGPQHMLKQCLSRL